MSNPMDLTNAVVLHTLEDGTLEIMSTSTARIIIVDDQVSEMHQYVVHDKPSALRGFFTEDELRTMPVKYAADEYPADASPRPHLTLVK